MKILVTFFEPFGDDTINPSREVVLKLDTQIGSHTITKLEVPTVFHHCMDVIEQQLSDGDYDAVLSIGQAGGRSTITPERIGINIDDARIPDNAGAQPIDQPIRVQGEPAYFSNMPVKRMTQAMREKGIPARLSNTAGTFVCNHVLYQLGVLQATRYPDLRFGFIHVPYAPSQVVDKGEQPSMSVETMVKGLSAAIEAISYQEDLKIALGETH